MMARLHLCVTAGLPDPAAACFSAMPPPHIPFEQRPWRQQKTLNEQQFKVGLVNRIKPALAQPAASSLGPSPLAWA
jgi:hypothetical protein